MYNLAVLLVVCISLAISVFVGIYALFWSQSYKKDNFVLMQAMIILYLFGYLLELTSTNAEEAFAAMKVVYLAALFAGVFAFFFVADFCNVKLNAFLIKAPMVLIAIVMTIIMWTTKSHYLVYQDYAFDTTFLNYLIITPGFLYYLINGYPTFCMLLAILMLLYQMKKWKNIYRRQLFYFFLCIAIPFVANCVYLTVLVTGITRFRISFTPLLLSAMSFCLYMGIMRFNVFEIISTAAVTAMEQIREGFILVDENNNYLVSNSAAASIFPWISKLVKGDSVFSVEGWPEELNDMDNDLVEFAVMDDEIRHFRASISPLFAGNNALMAKIILLRETTDSVILMKELENAAYIDALTGLYNRKHFSELAKGEVERALRLNQSIYTAMLDLDFFKNVNDTYGHAAGDAVLKTTATVIRQTIRSYDLLCRYGGEEFVLLTTDLDPGKAQKLMERIRENIEHRSTNFEGTEIKITCSIGMAKFIETDTLESSVRKADEALYFAKNSGRNQVRVYDSSTQGRTAQQFSRS